MSFANGSNEFDEKSMPCQSMPENNADIPGIILELAPEWSYCEVLKSDRSSRWFRRALIIYPEF